MGNPSMRTVIDIRSAKPSHREADDANNPTPNVWFDSWRQLASLLSDENRALARTPRTLESYGLVKLHRTSPDTRAACPETLATEFLVVLN
jgi:predicted transcriptional regulator